jgi:GNAT superfamily N-acetyltransferase
MPFVVDRLLPGDLEEGLRLSTQAGWNQTASDWKRVLDLSPQGCLAGRLDGRLVATGSVAGISSSIRWIGMILVDEELRGRGYGSVMMDHCLELARGSGDGIVGLDASNLGRPVYLKKGFVDVAPIDRWSGVLRARGDPPAARQLSPRSLEQVAELDQKASGVDRSPLLKNLHSDPEAVCWGSFDPGREGFAFLLPGRTCSHVGPVVATNEAAFEDLLRAVSRHLQGAPVILDSLRTDAQSRLLERSGLTIARKLTRMTLGGVHPVLMGPMIRASVSFTWG